MGSRQIRRRYLSVDGHHVHYRRSGSGPPVVLLHESPKSSAAHVPLMDALSGQFTVFAFDTPGFGESDPLPADQDRIRHFADALAGALQVLRMPRCAVFGNHTGANIALEFGRRHPRRVTGLVLESLPIFRKLETQDILRHFFPPLRPTWDASHLTSVWSRVRDQSIWFPWFRRAAAARHRWPMPDAEYRHEYTMDFFRAGDAYRRGYGAAFRYSPLTAIRALTVPVTFVARKGDFLAPHIDRLPKLRRNQAVDHVGFGRVPPERAIGRLLTQYARGPAPDDPEPIRTSKHILRRYADLPKGQIGFREIGIGSGRPLVMLHDGPGSSPRLEPLMRTLGRDRLVIALDLPGNGASDPLDQRRPSISDYAASAAKAIRRLRLRRIDLYGKGSGASVAIEIAVSHPRLVKKLVLESVMMISARERGKLIANYTPRLTPEADGSHLYRTWTMLRDQLITWPWYDSKGANLDHRESDFDPKELQRWLVDVLNNRDTYHLTTQAAFRYPVSERLPGVQSPTLVCSRQGDRFHRFTPKAARLMANAQSKVLTRRPPELRRIFNNFLDG